MPFGSEGPPGFVGVQCVWGVEVDDELCRWCAPDRGLMMPHGRAVAGWADAAWRGSREARQQSLGAWFSRCSV